MGAIGSMHPTKTNKDASDLKVVKLGAKANLLMALLSDSDQNLESHKKEILRRDGELTHLRGEIERRDGELARLRGEIERRDRELGALRGQIERYDAELRLTAQQMTAIVRSREQALDANAMFLHSTSWRITAPLRALGRFVKRFSWASDLNRNSQKSII
jgi:chromosome segregation ATPase